VQAWQLKLEQLQNEMAQHYAHLSDKGKQLDEDRNSLENSEEQITEVGLRLRDVTVGLLDEAHGIAEVKLMQEDHEDELLKRLREVEEREEAIRQDEYIISQKNRGPYEKQAAEYRRKQTLSALMRELQDRIEAAHAIESELAARNGTPSGLIAHLPPVDDLPSF
jgi:chromosome segregation ATPase